MNKLGYQIGVMTAKLAAGMALSTLKPTNRKDSASRLAKLFQNQHSVTNSTPDNKTKPEDTPHDKERSFWGPASSPDAGDALGRQSDLGYDLAQRGSYGGV